MSAIYTIVIHLQIGARHLQFFRIERCTPHSHSAPDAGSPLVQVRSRRALARSDPDIDPPCSAVRFPRETRAHSSVIQRGWIQSPTTRTARQSKPASPAGCRGASRLTRPPREHAVYARRVYTRLKVSVRARGDARGRVAGCGRPVDIRGEAWVRAVAIARTEAECRTRAEAETGGGGRNRSYSVDAKRHGRGIVGRDAHAGTRWSSKGTRIGWVVIHRTRDAGRGADILQQGDYYGRKVEQTKRAGTYGVWKAGEQR